MQNILLQLNIADDYFKAREKLEVLKSTSEDKDKELYDVKHELITTQIKLKSLEESLQKLRDENNENQKKIVKLETELGLMSEEDEFLDDVPEGEAESLTEGTAPKPVRSAEVPARKARRKRH